MKHHHILHEQGPISGLDRGSGWLGNGPMKHSNTFHGGFPFYSLPTNSVPYGELAKGRGQMSGDIIVTMLTECEFIHQKVINLCSGKNLTFFAALRGWQQITIRQFSKSTRWFPAWLKGMVLDLKYQTLSKTYKSRTTKRLQQQKRRWMETLSAAMQALCMSAHSGGTLDQAGCYSGAQLHEQKSADTPREASFSAFTQRGTLEHLNRHHKNTLLFETGICFLCML